MPRAQPGESGLLQVAKSLSTFTLPRNNAMTPSKANAQDQLPADCNNINPEKVETLAPSTTSLRSAMSFLRNGLRTPLSPLDSGHYGDKPRNHEPVVLRRQTCSSVMDRSVQRI